VVETRARGVSYRGPARATRAAAGLEPDLPIVQTLKKKNGPGIETPARKPGVADATQQLVK